MVVYREECTKNRREIILIKTTSQKNIEKKLQKTTYL